MRWHRKSTFASGTHRRLDPNARALWREKVRRASWGRDRAMTRAMRDVAFALLGFLGDDGRLDPAWETIGRKADVARNTVWRALCRLRDLGLLAWDNRIVRNGERVEQTSNQYQLLDGEQRPLQMRLFSAASPRRSSESQGGTAAPSLSLLRGGNEGDAAAARAALARRRAALEAELLEERRKRLASGPRLATP